MFNISAAAPYTTYLSPFPSQALKKQFSSSTILIIKYYNLYQPLSLILLLLLVKENLFDWTQDMQPKPDLEAIEVTLGALLTAADSMTTTASDDDKKQQCHSLLDNTPSHQTTAVHQAYDDYDDEADVVMVPNYPDLVPRPNPPPPASSTASADLLLLKEASSSTDAISTQPRRRPLKASDPAAPTTTTPRQTPPTPTTTSTTTTTAPGPLSETMFLLALLFGTCFLLYIFPAGS